jgi:hypothetical protein
VREDREDARLKQILAGVFEETGIALPADDLVVDPARFFARPDFTDEATIAVPDCETRLLTRTRESGTRYVPSSVAPVSLRKTCST